MLVEPVDKYLKDNREIYTQIRWNIPEGIIAGGAARQIFLNEAFGSTDVDIYFPDFSAHGAWYTNHYRRGFEKYSNTNNASGYLIDDIKCQLVKAIYTDDPRRIFDSFDLTCCMFAIKDDQIYYTEEAAEHATKKLMVFAKESNAKNIYKRVEKYLRKGFVPSCPISMKIFLEFIQYVEEEYMIYAPINPCRDIFLRDDPFAINSEDYRKPTAVELEERIEDIFLAFFGPVIEDY